MDTASVSENAPAAERQSLLLRTRKRIQALRPGRKNMVGCDRHYQLRQQPFVWDVRVASYDPREWLQAARDGFRRRQSVNRDDRDHRPVCEHSGLAIRPVNVPAANRDERDPPPEWEGTGDGWVSE